MKMHKLIAMFMIMLVLTMPLISASDIQIITNMGNSGVKNYINANEDTWVVEVLLSHLTEEEVSPEDVFIKVGSYEENFDSCTKSEEGVVCKYISPLTNGISEGEYQFTTSYVYYEDITENRITISDSDVVKADGTAPQINNFEVRQKESKVHVKFSVTDKVQGPAVGIDKIEILEGETNSVLEEIEVNDVSYDQEGYLNVVFDGEGRKKLKLRIVDLLGNERTSLPYYFNTDFIKPEIITSSFNLSLGKFIGLGSTESDIWISIKEKSLENVYAESEQVRFMGNEEARCYPDEEELYLYHCLWQNVRIIPTENLQFKVIATDSMGNVAEQIITKSFIVDREGPQVIYFGSPYQFNNQNYAGARTQYLEMEIKDSGSGVNTKTISLDMGSLSNNGQPDECVQESGLVKCYWETNNYYSSDRTIAVGVKNLEDLTGNQAETKDVELKIDTTGPKVERMSFYGLSDIKKEYFQSNDVIYAEIEVAEITDVRVLVNMNYLATDAETKWPETRYKEAGWQEFDTCYPSEEEGKHLCVIETGKIKSGPDRRVPFEIKVVDTAGNDASLWPETVRNVEGSKGRFYLDIRGLDTESNPDYWTLRRATPTLEFIDIDTTPLTYTRIPFKLEFISSNIGSRMLNIEVVSCQAEGASPVIVEENVTQEKSGPEISRFMIYGGNTPDGITTPKPNLMLEFAPFDGQEYFKNDSEFTKGYVNVNCTVNIYSEINRNALASPEIKTISLEVPFGYTELGAVNANLEAKIKEAREDAQGFWTVIGHMSALFEKVTWLMRIINMVFVVIELFEAAKKVFSVFEATPTTKGAAISGCFTMQGATTSISGPARKFLQPVVAILSCTYPSGLNWYDSWMKNTIGMYNRVTANLEILKSPETNPNALTHRTARSAQDNIFLSVLTLCLPGVVKNLDKYRQIKCRKIVCLEQDVTANRATIAQCEELERVMTCKYFLGELLYLIPGAKMWDTVIGALKGALSDPISVLHTLNLIFCGTWCLSTNSLSAICNLTYWLWEVMDFIQTFAGFIYQSIDMFKGGSDYCEQAGVGPGW
jgi:hypothetical protein